MRPNKPYMLQHILLLDAFVAQCITRAGYVWVLSPGIWFTWKCDTGANVQVS